ncbi:Gfo/Idh/MocA family oxidoreductase [Gymnodinialimonas sp. 57CJ19]|uniref:Gfo/Idh/MocA family protein n=1 Tax=Gymnodinialimonas sp. 57CJ19 TaxID=3138498 RepID=UPI0031343D6A
MSDSVRLAISGFGLIGQRHAKAVAGLPGVALVGVVEPGEVERSAAAALGVQCYTDLAEMIAAQAPDGVIIATPTPLHAAQAMTCIERGVPILIEKPLAPSVAEGVAVAQAADAGDVPVLVGHHRRHNPLIKRAFEAIEAGDIGEVRAVQATCWFYKPDSYFEKAPWRKQVGAGPISVNLVHDVDLIRHLCGEVRSVRAVAAPSRRGFANEDVAAAVLELENGAIGTLTVSDSIAAPWSWEMTAQEHPVYPATPESCYLIGGSKGALSVPDLRVWSHAGPEPDWWTPISATSITREAADPLVAQLAHFAAVILGQTTPLVSGWEGLRTLEVVEAIQVSAASGQVVRLGADAGSPRREEVI